MERVFEVEGPQFVTMAQYLLRPPSADERFCIKMVERYAPYLRFPEAVFDQSNVHEATNGEIESPYLTDEQIDRLISAARTKQLTAVL